MTDAGASSGANHDAAKAPASIAREATMGDAADDAFDAMLRDDETRDAMLRAGCKPCLHPEQDADGVCIKCDGMGWLDSDGQPCEP